MVKHKSEAVFFPPAFLEDEDPKELARIREELRGYLRPAPGIEELWTEVLIAQALDLRRLRTFEKKAESRFSEWCRPKVPEWKFNLVIKDKGLLAQLVENVERRMQVTLREIEHHKEFTLRAQEVIALHSARQPPLIEGRVSPSQPKARRKRRHEAADETAPSLVPEQEGDLESEEAVAKTESSVGDEGTPADEAEEVAEGDGAAAGDNEASDEEAGYDRDEQEK
jgi:hypothetical protein